MAHWGIRPLGERRTFGGRKPPDLSDNESLFVP